MKFTTWPLVKREALVRGFRPGSTADAEAPFRTLRRKGSVTAGVTVVVHSGGHIAGKHQAFSALNFDGARLARQDRWDDAHRLEEAAAQVEQSVEMAELVTLLRHAPVDVTEAYLNGHMPAQSDYPMLWHLTTVLAQRTAALREELLGQEGAVSIGVVEPGRGAVTVIKTENGGEVPVPSQLTNGLGLGTVGSIVTLFSDVTAAGQLLMDLLPAFRVSEQDAACRFDPFAATKEPLVIPADAAKKPTRARRRVAAPLPVSG